jgi:ADP-heptose:LPS heptosyltransferase
MAPKRPVLVLQMQRLGDLVLCFPLLRWLARRYPGHPLWIVAEERFSTPLLPLSPHAAYIPADQTANLGQRAYAAVLNLSIRPEAARLAHQLQADEKWGLVMDDSGRKRILGNWLLYRASLVRNNRHNRFHWADLNGLDCVDLEAMAQETGPSPRPLKSSRVGLFLGASEPGKKPSVAFYRSLAAELTKRGLQPVLFGGPDEKGLGAQVLKGQPSKAANLCARLSVAELAAMVQTVSLFITPDTGPMHLAAWRGARTLNLSLGNVNAWETGPFQPGHYVLQPALSCAGCWGCERDPLPCHNALHPARVAALAKQLARPKPERLENLSPRGMRLLATGRDAHGLHELQPVSRIPPTARDRLRDFWSRLFGANHGLWGPAVPGEAWREFEQSHPQAAAVFRQSLERTAVNLLKARAEDRVLEADFWSRTPLMLRPFTGYAQMLLENGDYGRQAWTGTLALLEMVRECSRSA